MFGDNFDNTLVFDRGIAAVYLTDKELLLCIETGILLQSKETGHLTSEELNYSFLHKMFHELLAALFISSKTDLPKAMLPKIVKKFNNINDILRMDMFLVFLSGFTPSVAKTLSQEFVTVVSQEELTSRHRRNIGTIFIKDYNKMHELSDLMLSCVQEIDGNYLNEDTNEDADVYLDDIFIDKKCAERKSISAMSKLVACNKDTIKSLYIHVHQTVNEEQINGILSSMRIESVQSLDKLFVWGNVDSSTVNSVLANSKHSLHILELWNQDFTGKPFPVFQAMNQISGLSLMSLKMSHKQILDLMTYISQNDSLKHLNLNKIECSGHGTTCEGYKIRICPKAKPQILFLDKLFATNISVNTEKLDICVVEWLTKIGSLESMLTCLERSASSLKRFECDFAASESDIRSLITAVPKFVNLIYLRLRNIKIGGNILKLSGMYVLMRIHIWHSSMSANVFQYIVNDLESLDNSVIVILDDCEITPDDEEQQIREYVKTCERFEVIKEERRAKYKQFHFRSLSKQESLPHE